MPSTPNWSCIGLSCSAFISSHSIPRSINSPSSLFVSVCSPSILASVRSVLCMVPSSPSPRVSGSCPSSSSLTHSSSSSSSHSHSHSSHSHSHSESSSASSSPSTSPLEQLRTIKTNPEHHKHETGKQNTTTHQTRRLSVEPLTSTPLIDKPTASSANPPQPTKMTESIRLASQHRLEQEPFIEEEGESERYRVPSPSSGQIDIKK